LLKSRRTLLRHRWLDESVARRAVPPDMMARQMQRVAASEQRHTGQIRIGVEAGLPLSYLWRHFRRGVPLRQIVRERRFEDGLTGALEDVSAVLVAHFPSNAAEPGAGERVNELPDVPVLL
jgi:hypothetical protein